MNPLQLRLAALRRRFRFVVTFRGLCWLLTILLGTASLAGWLDWRVHLPSLVRAVILCGTMTGGGYVAYRYLIRPLWAHLDDLALALRVESLFPYLNDNLASAVQFLEVPENCDQAGSPGLRQATVQRAFRKVQNLNFNQVVNTRGMGAAGLSVVLTGALAVALVLLNPDLAWTALERLANPFGGLDWPRQTRLEIKAPTRIARGDSFEVRGQVHGVIPEQAVISYDGITPPRQTCDITRDTEKPDSAGTLVGILNRVDHSFRFQVRANDAVTEWQAVEVLPPPVLVPWQGRPSPQVHLDYPAYTDLPPLDLPDGSGNVEAVAGTRVTFRAATDRPVARAWIEYRPEPAGVKPAAFLGLFGAVHLANSLALGAAGQAVWEKVPVQLDAEGRVLSATFLPRVNGTYALRFEDESGLGNTRLFDLNIHQDPEPTVELRRPSRSQDSLDLVPGAEITVEVVAKDPLFAVRTVYLEYRCAKEEPPSRLPLYDHETVGKAVPAFLAGVATGPSRLALAGAPPLRLRPKELQVIRRFPVGKLRHADGKELKEGDMITLQACADDFDDVAVDKKPGRSHEIELRIVSRAALDSLLNQAQAQVQQELVRLQKLQQEAMEQVIGPEQQWRNTGKLRPQDVDQLHQAEQLQQQIRARVGTKQEGLRADVARILQTLKDNQLPRSGNQDRMETVAGELDRLARRELEQIEQRLTSARKENEQRTEARKPTEGQKTPLGEARQHQQEVDKTLTELLKLLEPWGGLNQVKGEARAILQEQTKLAKDTENLAKETRGQASEELPDEQKAALGKAAEMQGELEKRTAQLLGKMDRASSQQSQEQDPLATEGIKDALDKGRKGDVAERMKNAAQNLRNNRLGAAQGEQQKASQTLEQMVKALEEHREKELDRLIKKMKETQDKLDDLAQRQDELRKKIKQAQQIADPKEREQALKQLAREQEKLRQETQEMVRELTRMRASQAGQALREAGSQMDKAGQQLGKGQDPEEQQEEALDRLNEARRRLNQAQAEAEEELAREKLAKIADEIKGLKQRQEGLVAESARLLEEVLHKGSWERPLVSSLLRLRDDQEGLAQETLSLAKNKLAGAKVFAHMLRKSGEAMEQAGQRIQEHKDQAVTGGEGALDPKAEKAACDEVRRLQGESIRRIDKLLEALKPEGGIPQRATKPQEGEGQPGSQSGQQGGGDNIPPLAQLKALRALQQEVNERTETFDKHHPKTDKLTKPQKRELQTLEKEQQEVADLLEEVTAPAKSEGGDQ